MNIQQFQYVLAVADSKNFEEAAERCFITQSTLSTMIARFEGEIGMKIFNRKTKPVSITTEGLEIIQKLRVINNEISQLENVIQELKGEMIGELKIGIIPTIAPYLLPLFLSDFATKFQKIKIIVKEIPTSQIIESLKNRSLDIGILALPILDSELIEKELFVEPFLVYDCRDKKSVSKISINELDYSRLLLLQEGHCLRTQVHQICELSDQSPNVEINFEFESASMDSLLRFTKANQGMTIIPYLASLEIFDKDKKNIVAFKMPIPSRSVGMLTHKFFVKKRLASELQKIIHDAVLELIPKVKKAEIVNPV
ncbi:LysR family transcriptional regulator [Vicingus serpentipes]|uniref:LysR family transcriptional regulator n=1 Tax=Vicingus serpentipes TaxID=1926625 RepID=A0A5C6RXK8_9FLAO|nr:hydrogen peroxide-inducible genes activator [Vicingus serpentipes]TXB66735.1 LysR family transcriptional regulator [Vicingus serpentipes]